MVSQRKVKVKKLSRFIDLIVPSETQKTRFTTAESSSVVSKQQQSLRDEFERLISLNNLNSWHRDDPVSTLGVRFLIGAAPWSRYDMLLLDEIASAVASGKAGNDVIDIFDYDVVFKAGATQSDLDRYVPGLALASVFQPPVVGWWKQGEFVQSASGAKARKLLAEYYDLRPNPHA